MTARDDVLRLKGQMGESIVGQEKMIERLLLGLLADGHLLVEGLPGLAKTRAIKSLARHLDAKLSRIQFTPDLLPADITGSEIYFSEGGKGEFRFQTGPLFANLILADEVNRSPAKVQAALLEAMEERQITVAGQSYPMPGLFMVLATQNPIEQEGTYPLPEAQMDRFLMKLQLDYPSPEDEAQVLRLVRSEDQYAGTPTQPARLPQEVIFAARQEVAKVHVSPAIDRYLIDLVNATRYPKEYDADLSRWIHIGASPRGGISLDRVARAHAWFSGQDFVSPDDVRAVAHPVLRHRLQLSYDAVTDGVGADQVVDRLLDKVAIAT